jgi:hypothetical protein
MKNAYKILVEKPKRSLDHLGDLAVDGRKINKIFVK